MSLMEWLFRVKEPDEDRMKLLGRVKLFENLVLGDIDYLLDEIRELRLEKGEWLFREGDPGDSLFIIEQGQVEIIKQSKSGSETVVSRLGAEQFFGEMSLIRKGDRSASVRAAEPTVLLVLTEENFENMISSNHRTSLKITYNIAKVLSNRLDQMNQKFDDAVQSP